MTDLFSGLTVTATLPNMDTHTVINTFFSHWLIGLNGDGFGIPNKYVFSSTGRKLDTKEGRKLCDELKLIWKYPKVGKVITLSPDCEYIIKSFNALKVISPAVSEDILIAEAVFAHNSKLKKGTKLSPAQQVKGQQSEPASANNTTEFSPTNRLKHLWIKAQGKSKEVINQHIF